MSTICPGRVKFALRCGRGHSIRWLTYETLAAEALLHTVIIAMRFPWCISCEEKDAQFTKASWHSKHK
eukprot:2735293-Amphidinium_carterae.1